MDSGRVKAPGGDNRKVEVRPKVVKKKKSKAKRSSNAENAAAQNVEENSTKIKSRELAVVFNPQRDVIKPYHMDGDPSMYTEEMVEKRRDLKNEPIIIQTIEDFITLYQSDVSGYVGRKEYERLQTKIANILRPNIDPFELKKIIDEDWAADSQGMDKISKQNLFDGLFEMCDTWVPTIEPSDYKEFFDQLKFRIRYEGQRNKGAYDILR